MSLNFSTQKCRGRCFSLDWELCALHYIRGDDRTDAFVCCNKGGRADSGKFKRNCMIFNPADTS